jgi:phage terminase Nu1 subunit (DNA packaging protein)
MDLERAIGGIFLLVRHLYVVVAGHWGPLMKLGKNAEVDLPTLAHIIGRSVARVQQLVADGVLKKAKYNSYQLAQNVQAFADFRANENRHTAATAQAALVKEKTKAIAIKNAEADRRLIETEEAIGLLDEVLGQLKAEFDGLAATVTRELGQRAVIQEKVDGIFGRAAKRAKALAATGALPLDDAEDEEE